MGEAGGGQEKELRNHQTNPILRLFIHRANNKLVK